MKSIYHFVKDLFSNILSLDWRAWTILLMVVGLAGCAAWFAQPSTPPTPTLLPTLPPSVQAGPTATPFPAELLNNQQQTIGLTLVAGLLVLVVVIAVFNALTHFRGDN